ncbi:hypothetical protein Scep_000879 [Stephania cephalantha]|uniref:Uncharacterized protein n=1 Tax=Stephania cephalantha TaxID=152367 RepID=A0AAP0L6Y9_9MAGN
MDGFMESISLDENVFNGGDLNGHVGASNDGFERVHGGFSYGNRNEEGESVTAPISHKLGPARPKPTWAPEPVSQGQRRPNQSSNPSLYVNSQF